MSKRFSLVTSRPTSTSSNSAFLWQTSARRCGASFPSPFAVLPSLTTTHHAASTVIPSLWTRDFSLFSGSRSNEEKKQKQFNTTSVVGSGIAQASSQREKMTDATEAHKVKFDGAYVMPHPIWPNEFIDNVQVTHVPPKDLTSKLAYFTVKLFRFNFDWMSGYMFGRMTEGKWVNRICFLETVAGVPGFIGGLMRHLHSLRRMRRDYGWIHTLVEEAENERIHLLTALQLKQPSMIFKAAVWLTQGIFTNWFFFTYLVYPSYCHRFVGYLEEEAVRTYTHAMQEIDTPGGSLHHWKTTPAPEVAKNYWKLPENATLRDVVLVIRADEAHHREVNHTLAEIAGENKPNPFLPGKYERHTYIETPK